jgi:pimeloyl-ACP methyl ester carboxylesterase
VPTSTSTDRLCKQISYLVAAGYTAIAPDMLGYGATSKPQEPEAYQLKHVVRDLGAILDALKLPAVHVVGHDWGAAVAWRLAMQMPHRVVKLVVLSVGHPGGGTAAGGSQQRSRWWYFLFFQYRGVAEQCLQHKDWRLFREFLGRLPSEAVDNYIAALSAPGALPAALNWYRANFQPRLFGAVEMRDFAKLRMPVMGVWSDGDTALLEEQMKVSGRWVAPGRWRYERLAGAGHWIPRDAPEQLNELLASFLAAPAARL